ncbi:3-Oxoacyl-[acyl-carrier-protein (ACP)] synthase III [Phaeobacter gallaeciensis]|uniref:3-Oxoacyl-[acyl-carrier-protein (ACP)] synthase III n=1 Tax=Phaeobacter gallaeciensis TaxID=60890 RepID=A0AAC9Z887_9RHOB|nr:3-Oxoacyl-[acyl-carrier-protein (ACP)] synthase III [Phaeobacter gallaeciensis]AHD09792.1 3-Oxoacyl-[acyl-carrier-protein (ACP)] synthase III [Phaeobacter gallaeciensis DSM 26640]ATE93056.1 3-Oxoacyl-[acyl-carrier-protein (ACP)] synthase III [Phaeobacter gallaeciensis]ATE97122.1 3-Oxoacyl-[acyl-carrier-protein (ACP)] synthase III [Phaeobacter gallaeciensis]ATF01721.1 3-Oxoacyl-[acyl-carrier-protein (ACP)] synthase III [Phaeobacter gallaeciensis]ATF06101.1 3-Oxoacyl-[acyl-carrier-protein (AC
MLPLNHICFPSDEITRIPLKDLGPSHGLTAGAVKMYQRFFELESVGLHRADLNGMLAAALDGVLAHHPDLKSQYGTLFYCRTQTHHGFADEDWLRCLADEHGLEGWDVNSLTMTSCASALAAMRFIQACDADGPVIVLTGEKAFHYNVARLPVGLLGELPTAALFNAGPGKWMLLDTRVRHMPRYYQNPDAMAAEDRRALQDDYLDGMIGFVEDCLRDYSDALRPDFRILPHNLNLPVTRALLRHFDWEDRCIQGDVQGLGHGYCSDIFVNLTTHEMSQPDQISPGTQLFVLAAGTGVTFATCLLERTDFN